MPVEKSARRAVARPETKGASSDAAPGAKGGKRSTSLPDQWRHDNIGRLLNNAVRRFEGRVLQLMGVAGYEDARISHVNLTRNLDREGTRLTELAVRSGMTKQAMGELVDQCESIKLVERETDPADKRAKIVKFTRRGVEWLDAFRRAVDQAEQEMRAELGVKGHDDVRSGLKRYGSDHNTLVR